MPDHLFPDDESADPWGAVDEPDRLDVDDPSSSAATDPQRLADTAGIDLLHLDPGKPVNLADVTVLPPPPPPGGP